jgi:predicted nucleic acid-binding protein
MTRHFRPVVWWGTRVEAVSGIRRLLRENLLKIDQAAMAISRLDQLQIRWDEIIPTESVRETAELLLGRHKLRAADALQLAAALEWCGHHPRGKIIIGADNELLRAAAAEGFTCRLL